MRDRQRITKGAISMACQELARAVLCQLRNIRAWVMADWPAGSLRITGVFLADLIGQGRGWLLSGIGIARR